MDNNFASFFCHVVNDDNDVDGNSIGVCCGGGWAVFSLLRVVLSVSNCVCLGKGMNLCNTIDGNCEVRFVATWRVVVLRSFGLLIIVWFCALN